MLQGILIIWHFNRTVFIILYSCETVSLRPACCRASSDLAGVSYGDLSSQQEQLLLRRDETDSSQEIKVPARRINGQTMQN